MIRAGALSLLLLCASAAAETVDLSLTQTAAAAAVPQGGEVRLVYEIFNPSQASAVVHLIVELPNSLGFLEVIRPEGWFCGLLMNRLTCSTGGIAQATETVVVVMKATTPGVHRVRAWINAVGFDGPLVDPNHRNNQSRVSVRVGNQSGYERILLPVVFPPTPGAHGSIWATELWARNDSDDPVSLSRFFAFCHITCPTIEPWLVQANSTKRLPPVSNTPLQPGYMVYVPLDSFQDVSLSLRAFDSSREELNFGTEIPVLREFDLFRGRFVLPDIPIEPDSRLTLRIYDAAAMSASRVRVGIYPPSGDAPIRQFDLDLHPPSPSGVTQPVHPAQFQIQDLTAEFPELLNMERVRIEVDPLPEPGVEALVWGFISITNNNTQRITTVTPQ